MRAGRIGRDMLDGMAMRPLIVSTYDQAGGAARAAMRLGAALRDAGTAAEMLVADKSSDRAWVLGRASMRRTFAAALRGQAGRAIQRASGAAGPGVRSLNRLPSRLDRVIAALPHDVVNLHWLGDEMLSIEAIGRIPQPVVWTLHDMWPFAGTEHYAAGEAGWRTGYRDGPAIDRATWARKRRAWRRRCHVVAPSRWLAGCAAGSALMADWPVRVIPNPLDLATFRPWPRMLAREMLGLPADRPLVGFGAIGGTGDLRKGGDLLRQALALVAAADVGAEAVLFGQSRPADGGDLALPAHWTGHLSDEIALALLYSAVDLVVVPSRQDNLPQTATEAQACGCPVAAFDVGGMADAVADGATGLLAPAGDVAALAGRILALFADASLRAQLGSAARLRAERLWAPAVVAPAYADVYREALATA